MNENIKLKDILKISILKPSLYINLLGIKFRKAILALLIACLIPGIIGGVTKTLLVGEGIDLVINALEDEENSFEIRDGKLEFEKEKIKIEELNSILYVDTNKELKDLESLRSILVHKDMYSAFLKDGVSVKYSDQQTEFKYSEIIMNEEINNKSIIGILSIAQNLKYVIVIIETISIFIDAIINSFIIYLLGSLISKIKRVYIPAKQLYKMSIFALILPAILQVNYTIGSYSIIIGGVYISLAINTIRNNLLKPQN